MVLVTGATGFIGSHFVVRFLEEGKEVSALHRSNEKKAVVRRLLEWKNLGHLYTKIHWCKATLQDPVGLNDALQGVDTVVHAAAMVSFKYKDQDKLYRTNVEGTTNLINACLEQAVLPKLLFISSTSALDIPHLPKPERDQPVKVKDHYSFYGLTKFLGELEVFRGKEEGMKVACINPGVITGEAHGKAEINGLFALAQKNFPWYSGAIHGFTHIDDVLEACSVLMEEWPNGQHPIISENLNFKEVQTYISSILNKRAPKWKLNKKFAWFMYALGKGLYYIGLDLGLSRESIRTATHDSPVESAPIFDSIQKRDPLTGIKAHALFIGALK